MKIYLVNDSSSDPNWGARSNAIALKKMIRQYGGEINSNTYLDHLAWPNTYQDPENNLAHSFKQGIKKIIPPLLTETISNVRGSLNPFEDVIPSVWEEFDSYAEKVIHGDNLPDEKRSIQESDIVVINGAGSILGRSRESRMILFIAWLAKKYYSKPVILINHTADLRDPVLYEIAENIYPLLDDITFREPASAEQCSKFSDGLIAGDASFIFEPCSYDMFAALASRPGYFDIWPDTTLGFNPSEPYICIGGSGIFSRIDPDKDGIILPALIDICTQLQDKQLGQVVLTASDKADEKVFRLVANVLNLPLIALKTPIQQAVDILGNARLYIGGRWHSSIFALAGGTPVISFTASSFKMRGLYQQFNIDVPVIDTFKLSDHTEMIVKLAKRYIEEGEQLRSTLGDKAKDLHTSSWEHVRFLKKWEHQEKPIAVG